MEQTETASKETKDAPAETMDSLTKDYSTHCFKLGDLLLKIALMETEIEKMAELAKSYKETLCVINAKASGLQKMPQTPATQGTLQ